MKIENGLAVGGSPATERIAPCASAPVFTARHKARYMSDDDFIERYASGTLRKNKRLGLRWKTQYLHERTAFEFGYGFETLPETRVAWGAAMSEGDERALTEVGWHIDRYVTVCIFPGDVVEAKYITVEYPSGQVKKGVGMIVRRTSAQFIPDGYVVFAIVAEFDDVKKCWMAAVNPC